ncbi:50S ribosomal protein L32e [archaeon BMS3Abin16]|nr:50S ribosomal protein L32e [archaeon BMS3Abin16]
MNSKKKPLFRRTQGAMYRRLKGKGWRRPTGKHNKIRECKNGKGEVPRIGYGARRDQRGLHPSGLEDVLVTNISETRGIDPKTQAARIASVVGRRKKLLMLEELKKRKVRVLNPLKV